MYFAINTTKIVPRQSLPAKKTRYPLLTDIGNNRIKFYIGAMTWQHLRRHAYALSNYAYLVDCVA